MLCCDCTVGGLAGCGGVGDCAGHRFYPPHPFVRSFVPSNPRAVVVSGTHVTGVVGWGARLFIDVGRAVVLPARCGFAGGPSSRVVMSGSALPRVREVPGVEQSVVLW